MHGVHAQAKAGEGVRFQIADGPRYARVLRMLSIAADIMSKEKSDKEVVANISSTRMIAASKQVPEDPKAVPTPLMKGDKRMALGVFVSLKDKKVCATH